MSWEPDGSSADNSYSSAWEYVYPQDPDLSNCTITLTITAPQFDTGGNQITTVSFGMKDINGLIRSWNWACGPPASGAPIIWNVPTTVNINTAATGVGASIPMASGYMSPTTFDITQVITLIVDENATWIGPGISVPPPGTTLQRPWNLWADLLITKNPSNPIVVGVNIDVHQDIFDPTGGPDPNDFHIEGRIESGLPDGTWSNPPVLITHVDGEPPFDFPNFTITITPDTTDPSGNWYIVKADWSGKDIPYCTVIHLGLEFEVTCHNIIIDLVGWWTLSGQPINTGINTGSVPIAGFEVQDNVGLPPTQQGPQRIRLSNENLGLPLPGQRHVDMEIVRMELAGVSPAELTTALGTDYFLKLREGGDGLEDLPWVPVENMFGLITPSNPQGFHIDSFFDVTFELTVPSDPLGPDQGRAAGPVALGPGDFLIARQQVSFTNNAGAQGELRWFFEIHEAHNESTHDLGDAPDSSNHSGAAGVMTAYPKGGPAGKGANYPTVYDAPGVAGSPPYGPIHWQPTLVAHLGQAVTGEVEADVGPDMDPTNNIIPLNPQPDTPDLDFADDGVLGLPFTLTSCNPMTFKYLVNVITPNMDMYVNVWFDWNRDGDWDDTFNCPIATANVVAPEWAVQNQLLSGLPLGLNTITSTGFRPYLPTGVNEDQPIWMRITLTDIPVQDWSPGAPNLPGYGGSGPQNGYDIGETEDYYFTPKKTCCANADLNCSGFVDIGDLAIFAGKYLTVVPIP
ncbi:hypothetical protein KAR91_29655 [Candidatus Pacearchaeota archaeon]|nr:hypothetical protein [Candidatus Pacearchaeota archaeon]